MPRHSDETPTDIYADLPSDPEEAFLHLEQAFEEQCRDEIQRTHSDDYNVCYVAYISKVLAAIQELGLTTAFKREVPSIEEVSYGTYVNFRNDVEHYKTQLRIRHARRNHELSVKFDTATKQKIRHFTSQIRGLIEKTEIDERRREGLLSRLRALEAEVDRNRTRFDVVAAFTLDASDVIGESAGKLEPLRKLIDSVSRLIWGAKQEETKALPPPAKRQAIEGPKSDLDDEIPF